MQQQQKNIPEGMVALKIPSSKPWLLAAAVWILAAFIFPMHRLSFILITAGVSCAAFLLGKRLFPSEVTYIEKEPDPADETAVAVHKGRGIIKEIAAINDRIADEGISLQMDRIEKAGTAIFDHLSENPGKLTRVRRFMNYYLPTAYKLLSSYEKLSAPGMKGENIEVTMSRIKETMVTVADAFEKQYDDLFGGETLDISADIDVLEQMLKSEGLSESNAAPAEEQGGITLTL